MLDDFARALQEWKSLLKLEQIQTEASVIDRYARSTGGTPTRGRAVLFPRTTEEVSLIAKTANAHGIAIYPISRGKNWGYGDACAPREGQVIVDLSRMNRILEVNTKSAYAVIEPGVSQGQLWSYLEENEIDLWMDATGAGPDASFIGNTAERGFGHTRYGDHSQNSCSLEVVLADGRILKTGYGHYERARAKNVYRYGIGPVLDGLFSQSNLGIITGMTVWLMPKPEDFCAFFFSGAQESDLEKMVDILSAEKRQGSLQSAVHVANDIRTLSGKMRYPWQRMNNITPLSPEVRKGIREEIGIGAWNGCGSISGSKEVVGGIRRRLQKTLSPYKPVFLNDRRLHWALKCSKALEFFHLEKSLKTKLEIVTPIYEMLKGRPVVEPLSGASWRVRKALTPEELANPLDSGAGVAWLSPVCRQSGAEATELVNLLRPIYHKHGFDFLVTFTLLDERSMMCVTNIAFDTALAQEVQAAKLCYDELSQKMQAEGFLPYRTGPAGFKKLAQDDDTFWAVAQELKRTLDPKNIISPGRYEPR